MDENPADQLIAAAPAIFATLAGLAGWGFFALAGIVLLFGRVGSAMRSMLVGVAAIALGAAALPDYPRLVFFLFVFEAVAVACRVSRERGW